MRFGSVCSGIEAASVAWEPLGWKAAWVSEIEPFPSAVLAHHYPDVPNYGDMTTLPDRILAGEVEAPDLFCGGTPCQAFSVAGLRRSLDDVRGICRSHSWRSLMQLTMFDALEESPPASSSGRTSPEFCQPLTTPSAVSSGRSLAAIPPSSRWPRPAGPTRVWLLDPNEQSRGASWMPNSSAWPNDAAVCSLSQVLEKGSIPPRFYLSGKACAGILRRAEKRGKELPPQLRDALMAVAQTAKGSD